MLQVKLPTIILLFSVVLCVCSASRDYKSANLKLGFDLLEDLKGGSSIKLRSFKESEEERKAKSSDSSSESSSSDIDLRRDLDYDQDALQDYKSKESDKAETSNEKVNAKSESDSDERRERSTIGLRSAESGGR